ncbi:hypothetical protein STAFG_0018 [Streptomyces afghaniensis 772]|uniref:Uncharacterized protein n=1 Tax=Streptomyces afghaniensis 772 TaxID=1283301 RepID=S4N4D4_9ACTN|nr:hypothetical protein STAFG_0018 [Streptomyces afghaniensis 772]
MAARRTGRRSASPSGDLGGRTVRATSCTGSVVSSFGRCS